MPHLQPAPGLPLPLFTAMNWAWATGPDCATAILHRHRMAWTGHVTLCHSYHSSTFSYPYFIYHLVLVSETTLPLRLQERIADTPHQRSLIRSDNEGRRSPRC